MTRCWIVSVVVVVLGVVSTARSAPSEDGRIINGKDAELGQFPYQALLKIETPRGRALCGGSVVNEEWILTAGHCVQDASSFEVTMGAIFLRSTEDDGRVVMNATEYIQHEDYNGQSASNDIAVIKLPSKVQFSNRIQAVQLPTGHDDYNRRMATVSGWGKTSDMGGVAKRLQYATLQVIRNSECRLVYPGSIETTTLCTRGDQQSTCNGDSGGPLVLEDDKTLIGVVSFGHVIGCEKKLPVAFARVTEFADWIREKTGMPAAEGGNGEGQSR
ncbi:collagenase [Aedes albopictus]|uniref:Peptidase S1 domain-containing protein n=1 Tax=Aedes albopictus TaxID=7160 RepID=A0ABM2A579_AEDAL|nr:collagenase-like [Aedes albopictus]